MERTTALPRRFGVVVLALALLCAALVAFRTAPAGAQVRGFDGETITVAGLGIKQQLPLAELGAQARIKRFNDTNEIKGVKIEYAEFADDKQEAATTLSEARRLVTQVGVFAIVGDESGTNPEEYFAQQKVPYFGGGFDHTYCSSKPSTDVWGFAFAGCIITEDPSWIGDLYRAPYMYVSEQTGKKRPTAVVFGADNESGKRGNQYFAVSAQGAGFKVTDVQSTVPQPSPSDYTPYVQEMLTGADGAAPDVIFCQMSTDCIPIYSLLRASGYEGIYVHGIYSDALVKPMEGSVAFGPYTNLAEPTAGYKQMKADMDAFEAGSSDKLDFGSLVGYTSTDMLIQTLKKVAAKGKSNITPEAVQKAASKMTFEIDGVFGPTQYPNSTVYSYPACLAISESDGTTWKTAVPLTCSKKKHNPNLKLG
jgi:ABC-type branched-subunit amino acid transport system substrate-binding protein